MPHNPEMSTQVAAYIDPAIHRRMGRVLKKNRRYSISRQIECALTAHMSVLERLVGLKPKRSREEAIL